MLNIPMTREQFAEACNIHPDQVSRYVTNGVLEPAISERVGKRYRIDYVAGKALIDAHRDMSKSRIEIDPDMVADAQEVIEYKASKLKFEALLKELEYRKELGELVEASVIEAEAFNEARLTRDRLLQIPNRVSDICAAETNSTVIFNILRDEINRALEMLASGESLESA